MYFLIGLTVLATAALAQDGYGAQSAQPAPVAYGAPVAQPVYQPQPPTYYQPIYQPAPYALPNYDVNYCTVHASFPLVEHRRHNKHHSHHRRDRRQAYDNTGYAPAADTAYGEAAPAYGQPAYASPPVYPAPASYGRYGRFDRQSCRHTAIYSQSACDTCCKISSRAASDFSSYEITGALFVFDPNFDDKSEEKDEDNDKRKAIQCVCCAPKRV